VALGGRIKRPLECRLNFCRGNALLLQQLAHFSAVLLNNNRPVDRSEIRLPLFQTKAVPPDPGPNEKEGSRHVAFTLLFVMSVRSLPNMVKLRLSIATAKIQNYRFSTVRRSPVIVWQNEPKPNNRCAA
jgi:hypothetical protein